MSSKVIVNLPTDPFQQQISKTHQEVVNAEISSFSGHASADPVVRANQLEQNIRFLQEQHQIMLAGLHSEIETLRQRNRDLQFQIVFPKGVAVVHQSSPSSDEDCQRSFAISPGHVNITPLQVEILERNVAELKTNLSESRTRNVYLQNVIDELKKRLAALENGKADGKADMAAIGKKIGKENVTKKRATGGAGGTGEEESGDSSTEELQEKLEDADRLIRRLRRENEEQRKEIVSLRTSMNKGRVENRRNEGNNSFKNHYRNGQSQTSRFPPVNHHVHWRHSVDNYSSPGADNGRMAKEGDILGRNVLSLPYLRDRNYASTSSGYSNPAYNNYQGGNAHKRVYFGHRKQEEGRGNARGSRRESQNYSRETSEK